jgi:hypothetical protein
MHGITMGIATSGVAPFASWRGYSRQRKDLAAWLMSMQANLKLERLLR